MTARRLRWPAILIGGAVVLVPAAVFVSAAVDEPSKVLRVTATVDAPERLVWRTVTDLEAYEDWNPTIVSAEGRLEEGATLDLQFRGGSAHTERREVEVLAVNPRHKLRWQDRMLLPGVRDRELTIRLRWLRAGRTLVRVDERYEGLLAPFSDTDG